MDNSLTDIDWNSKRIQLLLIPSILSYGIFAIVFIADLLTKRTLLIEKREKDNTIEEDGNVEETDKNEEENQETEKDGDSIQFKHKRREIKKKMSSTYLYEMIIFNSLTISITTVSGSHMIVEIVFAWLQLFFFLISFIIFIFWKRNRYIHFAFIPGAITNIILICLALSKAQSK